jgi:protein involved in ribonucleotide reduction
MYIVYSSMTGQVERFVNKIKAYPVLHIDEYDESLGSFILITYTTNFGEAPQEVQEFLKEHHPNMMGVCASGKQSWKLFGTYCKSADVIHEQYGVPILLKFEMAGSEEDVKQLLERIENIEQEKLY